MHYKTNIFERRFRAIVSSKRCRKFGSLFSSHRCPFLQRQSRVARLRDVRFSCKGAVCNRRLKEQRVCKWWVFHFLFVSSRNHCHEFFDGRFAFGKASFWNSKVKRCSKLTSESLHRLLFPSMVKRAICLDLEK